MDAGDWFLVGFLALSALLATICWIAEGPPPDEFPFNWCPIDCWPDKGQDEPCDDCPYLAPPHP